MTTPAEPSSVQTDSPIETTLEPTFWQKPAVQQIVPFATSLLFHLAVIALCLLIYKTVDAVRNVIVREQIIIPDTNLVENADNGGVPNPGINDDPTRAAAQNTEENVRDSKEWADQKSPTLTESLMSGAADVDADVTPIGAGATGGGAVNGLNARGIGDSGGNPAPFGPPGGGAGQGKGLFGIPGGNVRRVAYVCDATGSLFGTQTLRIITSELRTAISRLRTSQAFSVIYFRDGDSPPIVLKKTEALQLATPKNKEIAYTMLESLEVRGNTNPIPALKIAFAMQPELVFLFIHDVESTVITSDELKAEIDKLNASRKIRVNILLAGTASTDAAKEEVKVAPYREIAKANGGELRRVFER